MSRGTVNEDSLWMHKMKLLSLESPQLIQANVCNLEYKLYHFQDQKSSKVVCREIIKWVLHT